MEYAYPAGGIPPAAYRPMKPYRKPPVVESETSRPKLPGVTVRLLGSKLESPDCFRTQKRHLCDENECKWRYECRRLVADWRR